MKYDASGVHKIFLLLATQVVIQPSVGLENLATLLAKELLAKAVLAAKVLLEGAARTVMAATQVAARVVNAQTCAPVVLQAAGAGQHKHAHLALNALCLTKPQLANLSAGKGRSPTQTPILFLRSGESLLMMMEGRVLAWRWVGRLQLVC